MFIKNKQAIRVPKVVIRDILFVQLGYWIRKMPKLFIWVYVILGIT